MCSLRWLLLVFLVYFLAFFSFSLINRCAVVSEEALLSRSHFTSTSCDTCPADGCTVLAFSADEHLISSGVLADSNIAETAAHLSFFFFFSEEAPCTHSNYKSCDLAILQLLQPAWSSPYGCFKDDPDTEHLMPPKYSTSFIAWFCTDPTLVSLLRAEG